MKFFLMFVLMLSAVEAGAQTNCPGSTYLGIGQGSNTNFSASFPSGAGIAVCNGPLNYDQDAIWPTCTPSSWNSITPQYGTVTYNDGAGLAYTGAARFWFHLVPASTPYCVENGKTYNLMVARLKIQSCTSGHTLTNRFLAVSCDGSYCEETQGDPCDVNYVYLNWINLSISGF